MLVHHTLDVVNWDEIESVTMHIINASLESRDPKPPEWSIVIDQVEEVDEEILCEGSRNVH